jgi:hypothetical protein
LNWVTLKFYIYLNIYYPKKGGIHIDENFDLILDPDKSFNSPFKVGPEGKKIVYGRYSPYTDSMALLVNADEFGFENFSKDVFWTENPLDRAIQYHEFLGHVNLTKKSSYWTTLFAINFYSYLGFFRMLRIVEEGLVTSKQERIRKDTRDMIVMDEIYNHLNEAWRPLQEAIANFFLLILKKRSNDDEFKEKATSLIEANNAESRTIKELTDHAMMILDEFEFMDGWKLIVYAAHLASSPRLFIQKDKPNNFQELMMMKKDLYEEGHRWGTGDPGFLNPTVRYKEIITLAIKCQDEIKMSIKRGMDSSRIPLFAGQLCCHELDPFEDNVSCLIENLKNLATNENLISDEGRRGWHAEGVKRLEFLKQIASYNLPVNWFLNDIETSKIYYGNNKIIAENQEHWRYLYGNILKYQFLKSMKKGEDFIDCFEGKTTFCESDCESCEFYPILKAVRELYKETSDYSYDELKREGFDKERMMTSLLS